MNGSLTARMLSQLWFITVAVLAVAILYLAKVLLLPLGIAILFAFLLAPLVALLERLKFPRPIAALLVILAFATLLCAVTWALFTQLVAIANDLPTYRDNIDQKMQTLHTPSDSAFGRAERELQGIGDELGVANSTATAAVHPPSQAKQEPIGSTPAHPLHVREVGRSTGRLDQLGGIVEPLATALLAVVFTFFVLLQREDLRNRIIRLSGDRNLSLMTQAMGDASRRISRYFQLQLTVNLTFGSLITLVLYFIGLPHPVLFGGLAALCRFVPYIGVPVAGITPTLLSLAVFHGWSHTVLILGTFIILEVVTGNYVEPHIYGRHTGLSSLAILIAATFWTLIWGPVGLILSVPLTVCLVVMGSHVPSLEFLIVLLGDQPVIPPYTCFYQRMLAHDEREAADMLDNALKSEPLVAVYDSILLPALTLVEKDRQQGELDDDTVRFIRSSIFEMVDELGFRALEESNQTLPESGTPSAPPSLSPSVPALPKVAIAPVRDGSDDLVSTMLTQVLALAGFNAASFPIRSIDETVSSITSQNPAIVVLSGMPPVAIARANRLYRGFRPDNSELKVIVGIWNYADDHARAAQMISRIDPPHISTSLADVVVQVQSWIEPKPAVPEPLDSSPQLVSTPSDHAAA
ncbi:MAG TPA: AI-2E family transporter [Terracidiphilus sp.]|jgi:predicted PurR-regulated permease PerM